MGTTLTSLQDGGAQIGLILAVEGYDQLLTNGDPEAAIAAWSGEGWNGAINGLKVKGRIKQKWEPWSDSLDGQPLTFLIQPNDTDDFAKAVFANKPSKQTRLTQLFSATTSGSNMLVKNASPFNAGDKVYVGGEAMQVGSTSSQTLTFNANATGMFAPFTVDGGTTYPKIHDYPNKQSWDAAAPPKVTDVQRNWIGKWVALYAHRIVAGTWDSRSQAQLLYAGQIKAIQDDGMNTVLETENVLTRIRDTVLLRDQFKGTVKEGVRLIAGDEFFYLDTKGSNKEITLSVVESSPNGADHASDPEIQEGYYTLDGDGPNDNGLFSELNRWFSTQVSGGNTNLIPTISIMSTESGLRTSIQCSTSTSGDIRFQFGANRKEIMAFLGFAEGRATDGYHSDLRFVDPYHKVLSVYTIDETDVSLQSAAPPYRVKPFQRSGTSQFNVMELESTEGTWWDQTDWLPSGLHQYLDGDDRGLLQVNGELAFAKHDSDTQFTEAHTALVIRNAVNGTTRATLPDGLTVEDSGDVEVKQVIMLAGSLKDIFARMFASIEGNGTNNATYDAFPAQMSARIPWGLLGDNFTNSLEAIQEVADNNTVCLQITKPTKLLDHLMPELILRMAMLVWVADPDSGSPGLQFRLFPTPNSTTADLTLDETNKGASVGVQQDLSAKSRISHDWLRNVVKVEYNIGLDGEPRDSLTVEDRVSIGEYDTQRPVTIKARNSFGELQETGASVESLVGRITTSILPAFAKPVHLWRRTILGDLFWSAPGDTVQFSDDRVRDPDTGERGISNRAGVVLGVSYSLGGDGEDIFGEIEVLWSLEDRTFPYAPTADVDETDSSGSFTSGYDSGNKRLKLKQHAYTQSGDSKDVTFLATSDPVRITERDPDNPAEADSFTDTVAAKSEANDTIDLTTGFGNSGNPSFDSSKIYLVTFDDYGSATSDQTLHAYQADDGDGEIVDTIEPNLWAPGEKSRNDFSSVAATEAPALIATDHYGDGKPLHVGLAQRLARAINNGQNYLSAPQMPVIHTTDLGQQNFNTSSGTWRVMHNRLLPIGSEHVPAGLKRMISLAVTFKGDGGGSVTPSVRVTTSKFPFSGESMTDAVLNGPKRSVQFTGTTSTSWQTFSVQSLEPIAAANSRGYTWILIEAEGDGNYGGLTDYRVGALEAR